MIKFLTTQGINYHLEELLKNSQKEIILISPYIQLQKRIKEILSQKKDNGLDIIFVCRAKDLKENLSRFSTKVFDCPTLHAKCYMNENEVIVTSLNLYEFSQKNNEEMGFYIKKGDATLSMLQKWFLKNSDASEQIFKEIKKEAERLYKNQINLTTFSPITNVSDTSVQTSTEIANQVKKPYKNKTNHQAPISYKDTLVVGEKYSLSVLDTIFNFDYKGDAGIKKTAWGGEIVLFSYTSSPYPLVEKNGIIYYQGQNTGAGVQKLIYGNKDLYDSFKNKSITIHLFKDDVYRGKFYIVRKPYLENGRWIFPLAKK
ncbi:MAG: phospholipase D family protein [Methylococcales bacterium]|nr:phospholipase D family protein [Methylococcales bacterium]